ncbi:MAG TPA: RNA polymerase sigma factor [Candidatus Dormibacteraeota bacterium]|nr:RNA polymerase sigma factor [Candidatus Dormibacteraeota bacterium]
MTEAPYSPGSDSDFDRLYRDAYSKVLQTVTAIVGDVAEGEDCAQEAFERAYMAWPNFRPEAPAPAWVHRIAINVAITHRRRQALHRVRETLRRLGHPEPARDLAGSAGTLDLIQGLRRLPPRQAAVIVLRHLHGYSNREIAEALGVPERTIASRLATAKRKLAATLDASRAEGAEQVSARSLERGLVNGAMTTQHPIGGASDA